MQPAAGMRSGTPSRRDVPGCGNGFTADVAAARCRRSAWRGTCLLVRQQSQERQSRSLTIHAQKKEVKVKPAYNKYRSRSDIERDYVNGWKEVTARDGRPLPPMTPLSVLRFVPFWIKYVIVPEPLRFVWWLITCRWRAVEHRVHRHLVLEGAKLDVWLATRQGLKNVHFSRSLVLRRYHRKVSIWNTFMYRLQLLRGQTEELVYAT